MQKPTRNVMQGYNSVTMTHIESETLTWVARLPFWHHRQVLPQLALAFGLPLLFLLALMVVLEWPPSVALLALLGHIVLVVGGILLVLFVLGTSLVYAGGYWLEYHLDSKGIGSCPHGKTARKNRWVNRSLIIIGTLAGRPGAVGAGLLAQGHQREYVAWHDVSHAQSNPQHHTIALYGKRHSKRLLMVVACDAEDYERVWQRVQRCVNAPHDVP